MEEVINECYIIRILCFIEKIILTFFSSCPNKGKKNHIYRWQHEAANIYGKNDSTVHETVKKEREIYASFAVTSQAAKVMATVPDK